MPPHNTHPELCFHSCTGGGTELGEYTAGAQLREVNGHPQPGCLPGMGRHAKAGCVGGSDGGESLARADPCLCHLGLALFCAEDSPLRTMPVSHAGGNVEGRSPESLDPEFWGTRAKF